MLSKVMKKNYIQLDVEVTDFKEAIISSVEPFLEADVVTKEYVEKIVEIYEETGPYIVIIKNVALPHAPSDSGAKEVALGFTRLKNPVVSGHKTNDPVKYLFPLSAKDSQSHVELLSELAELLSDESFLEFLENATSEEDIIDYLEKFEGAK
ncbi:MULTISPECIES: PTS sugar transporter subunit IIA [Vagococcus]|uniref:PTS sugar transporter subunit IIA n=1 Tax=Vagococcus TaxID=2737 RepID=UPI002FCB7FFD